MVNNFLLECDKDWTGFTVDGQRKCMKLIGKYPAEQAVDTCQSRGSKVPLPQTEQADKDTYAAFKALGVTEGALDGSDVRKEGEWVQHSTGKKIKWFNWAPNEPNNTNNYQHYLWYWAAHPGKWDDVGGFAWINVICEKDL